MLYDSYDVEVLADRLEMEAEVIREMNELFAFEFTFKTDAEYYSARINGCIPEYNCVRMEIVSSEGWHMDFPVHTEEEYITYLSKYVTGGDTIVKTYQSTTFYEPKDWY